MLALVKLGNGLSKLSCFFDAYIIGLDILARRDEIVILVQLLEGTVAAGFGVVVVVFLAIQVDDDRPEAVFNFNLHGFGYEFILDFHDVSFPLGHARGGRDTKKAGASDEDPRQS